MFELFYCVVQCETRIHRKAALTQMIAADESQFNSSEIKEIKPARAGCKIINRIKNDNKFWYWTFLLFMILNSNIRREHNFGLITPGFNHIQHFHALKLGICGVTFVSSRWRHGENFDLKGY